MRLTYLSVDSLQEGVGASQVLAYVERLALKGIDVELHTFEKTAAPEDLRKRLAALNVDWRPRSFGPGGPTGGIQRILRGAFALRGAGIVHARSDLAAASALLARKKRWVWDFRSFYVDQKIELQEMRAGSISDTTLRMVERQAARKAAAIVVLTDAAIPILDDRFGDEAAAKAHVVTTCVDTARFTPRDPAPVPPLKLLLSGTVNNYYDVPLMLAFVERVRTKLPVEFAVVGRTSPRWERELSDAAPLRSVAGFEEMPAIVAQQHAGLSVCREDAGVSLKGSMPTKIGEFLACGRPVVVNPGLGDVADLIGGRGCGVILADRSPEALDRAVEELLDLVNDASTSTRCRELAMERFDLDRATDKLISIYDSISRDS